MIRIQKHAAATQLVLDVLIPPPKMASASLSAAPEESNKGPSWDDNLKLKRSAGVRFQRSGTGPEWNDK
jgi:hypothetical protein